MGLVQLLKKIHDHRFNDPIPNEALAEVDRELLLVRVILERVIEDRSLEEKDKEHEFENQLNYSIVNEDTRITHPIALNMIDASCEEAGVNIKIKRP